MIASLFAGLFVVVGAAREAGVTGALFDALHAREARGVASLAAAAAVLANLIVVEGARKVCPIGFAEYLKVGVPATLLTLAAGVILMR
jgi:Na+/H+ antiporter NhaD/arsenite permease-like protein